MAEEKQRRYRSDPTASDAIGLSDAMAAVVHETRRPVALARGYISMLLEGQLGGISEHQRSVLEKIDENLVQTITELERLGMVARVERDDPPSHVLEPVDLIQQAQIAIDRLRARITLTGGQVGLEYADGRPVTASADVSLLARILDNLVDNALVYSDGPPRVAVSVGYDGRPYVAVVDQGRGIEPELHERVFQRGVRADPGRPGSGLGLYLCRQAARQMGADLRLEWSVPGEGSRFRLDLRALRGPGLAILHRGPIR